MIESGALFSFAGDPTQVIIRVGVSFLSEQQACANAESEIGTATFDQIQAPEQGIVEGEAESDRDRRASYAAEYDGATVLLLLPCFVDTGESFSHSEGQIPDM